LDFVRMIKARAVIILSAAVIVRRITVDRALKALARRAQMNPAQATLLGLDLERRVASVALDWAFVILRVSVVKVDVMSA
jgi:hypothetical protein